MRVCGGGRLPSRLVQKNCIEWVGRVDDLLEEMKHADIFLSPLRVGSGIKNKILEATWVGLPVVCYDVSTEGLNAHHGAAILVAKNAEEFAEYTIELISNRELRDTLRRNARRFVMKYLSSDTSLDLYNLLSALADN